MNTKYRQRILELTKKYYDELDKEDFSHNSDHFFRVENLAKRIAEDEKADIEVIEAASLLFDVARDLEDKGKAENHAEKGVEIARKILAKIDFPQKKIDNVCHAISVHRRSKNKNPETLEAKILRDADYLDAMGAVDIARVFTSAVQSQKYKKPIFLNKPFQNIKGVEHLSAIHFLLYKINHPKHQPESFYTKLGKELAIERFNFMKEYTQRFIDEWHGLK